MIVWSYPLGGSGTGAPGDAPADNTGTNQGLRLSDYALDPATGDLAIPVRLFRGSEAVAQRIRVRFKWFYGEWFLDKRQGVPYYQKILVKNPDPILVNYVFKQVLRTTPGVKTVARFESELDRLTRTLTTDFEAILSDDSTLTATAEPFIIG